MWKWLRALLAWLLGTEEGPDGGGEARREPQRDARVGARGRSGETSSPLKREPLIVRGTAFYNTAEVERPVPEEPHAQGPSDVEGLTRVLLHATRYEDRTRAAEALGALGQTASAAVPALLRSVACQGSEVRKSALEALDAIDTDWRELPAMHEMMPFWAKTLSRGELSVNSDLTRQIVQIGASAVPGLVRTLANAGDVVGNVFVLGALGRLGPAAAEAVPEIARLLESEYSQVRIAAANALERIGPAAATAIPALRASRSHWNADVRRAVMRCLKGIDRAAQTAAGIVPKTSMPDARPRRSPVRTQPQVGLQALLARIVQLTQLSDMPARVDLCEQALSLVPREAEPMLWASLQNELAASLARSARGDVAKNVERAIHHCEEALKVFTRQALPQEWAMVQNNLASTYRKRISGNRAENIETAIACCERALEVRTRDADPEGWATSHNNLANAYRDRIYGERAENVEQTLRHCEQALEVFSPQLHPWKWATAQSNLANAYQDRVYGSAAENAEQAILHYQEALNVFTRESYPEDWAWAHCNLGTAYHTRVKGDQTENIEEAIRHLMQALEVYTRRSVPEEWAVTHLNLGNTYLDRERGESEDNLDKAAWHYARALEIFTREGHLLRWAGLQGQLAKIAERRNREVPHSSDSSASRQSMLSYPQFYEEESRLQPGEKLDLRLVFSKAPDSKYETSLMLVYQWEADLSAQEAQRLALRAVAYISCAIYDAARRAGLPCRASPIPNGRRPAWLIANERTPISLTLSDVDIPERVCQMSVGPMLVSLHELSVNTALLARLLEGFQALFGTISV